MRRRLGLATALVHDPSVLLLDEPTVGLDPEQRARVLDLVRETAADRIVLMASHVLDDARRVADRVVLLNEGRLEFHGTLTSLVAQASQGGARRLDATRTEDVERAYLSHVGKASP